MSEQRRRVVGTSLAVLVIAVALISRYPTSLCHCNDPIKGVKKSVCAFGMLRAITGVIPELAPLRGADVTVVFVVLSTVVAAILLPHASLPSFESRAPPCI